MRRMLDAIRTTLSPDVGIDIGTANTVVYDRGSGIIVCEPSVVAYDTEFDEIVAIGLAAKEMDGKAHGRIRVVHPLANGTISDFRAAQTLVATMIDRTLAARPRLAPRLVACVPGCATDIECKAVEQAVRAAGARRITFVPQAVAAAIGAGRDITGHRPEMVVDIGGGTTEIAVLVMAGVVSLHSLKIGGGTLDAAIAARLRAERFLIGPQTAEALKIGLGHVGRPAGRPPMTISGRDLTVGAPRSREVSETLVGEAIAEDVERIISEIWSIIGSIPPDLAADLVETGITLTGGGAQLAGLAAELSRRSGLPATVAPDPLLCVARGAGAILGSATLLERVRPSADRLTRWYQSLRIGMRESYSR